VKGSGNKCGAEDLLSDTAMNVDDHVYL